MTGVEPDEFWCHECRTVVAVDRVDDDFECVSCGATIICDVCGEPWSDHHDDHRVD